MDSTVLIAAVGVTGTVVAGCIVPLVAETLRHRRAMAAHDRDELTAVLDEALKYTVILEEMIDGLVDENPLGKTQEHYDNMRSITPCTEAITSRMWLWAPLPLLDAWKRLVAAEDDLKRGLRDDYPELGYPGSGHTVVDSATTRHIEIALQNFRAQARRCVRYR